MFDFDGLILDTESPIFQAWQELYQEYGRQLTLAEWENSLGSAEGTQIFYDNLEQQLGEPVNLEAIAPRLRARELEMIDSQPTSRICLESLPVSIKRSTLHVLV